MSVTSHRVVSVRHLVSRMSLGSQEHASLFSMDWIRQYAYAPRAVASLAHPSPAKHGERVLWNSQTIASCMPTISYDKARIETIVATDICTLSLAPLCVSC